MYIWHFDRASWKFHYQIRDVGQSLIFRFVVKAINAHLSRKQLAESITTLAGKSRPDSENWIRCDLAFSFFRVNSFSLAAIQLCFEILVASNLLIVSYDEQNCLEISLPFRCLIELLYHSICLSRLCRDDRDSRRFEINPADFSGQACRRVFPRRLKREKGRATGSKGRNEISGPRAALHRENAPFRRRLDVRNRILDAVKCPKGIYHTMKRKKYIYESVFLVHRMLLSIISTNKPFRSRN